MLKHTGLALQLGTDLENYMLHINLKGCNILDLCCDVVGLQKVAADGKCCVEDVEKGSDEIGPDQDEEAGACVVVLLIS